MLKLFADAITDDRIQLLQTFWSRRNKNYNYLSLAIKSNRLEIARWIIQDDPTTVHYRQSEISTWEPLMFCKTNESVKLLLEHGANVSAKDGFDITALHLFCWHKPAINIIPLLARGADERAIDFEGNTPISDARGRQHPQLAVLENFRNLMVLIHAKRNQDITLSTDLIRALQGFLY